ncbi:trimeric LpxA-like protein [Baffinella frigidus]|nr:trimeric LpxA-like protein [Cryptophyta sp. CCMP2293]
MAARHARSAPLGAVFRSIGSALESIGSTITTDTTRDTLSRHREVMALGAKFPTIAASCFVAPTANVMGNVNIGEFSSVWYGAIIRGDPSSDNATIGMSATIGEGATVGAGAYVAPGAVVEPGTTVAAGQVVAGSPAVVLRQVTPEESDLMSTPQPLKYI